MLPIQSFFEGFQRIFLYPLCRWWFGHISDAASSGYIFAVRAFLDAGISIETCKDDYNNTPLHVAAINGCLQVVRYLVEQGANLEARTTSNGDNTPLHRAAQGGHLEVVRYLVEQGADTEARTSNDNTALCYAIHRDYPEMVHYLIEQIPEEQDRGKAKNAALHEAAQYGHLKVVRYLVEQRADKEVRDDCNCNKTPLHHAAWYGWLAVVRYLVEQGADKEARDIYDRTPLYVAARNNCLPVVRYLVEQGADKDTRNESNNTLLHVLYRLEIVRYLVEQGADKEARNDVNRTPLHEATSNDSLEIVRYLVEQGADKEAQDNAHYTPLHWAIVNDRLEIVRYLVEQGADKEARDNVNQTPLHTAAMYGRLEIVRYLIEQGVNIHTVNQANVSPIVAAFERGHHDIVALLEQHGAVLPAHLRQAAGNHVINNNQSTHFVSVHMSVSSSVLALASDYLPGLKEAERKILRGWFEAGLEANSAQRQAEAVALLSTLLSREAIKTYIDEHAGILLEFSSNLQETDCAFSEHNTLKVRAAKSAMERMLDPTRGYSEFTEGRSGVPMLLAMALVWDGVWDQNNPGLMVYDEAEQVNKPVPKQERMEILVQAFYEMQRGYNLDEDDRETNVEAADSVICVPGHFNKVVATLAGGRHPSVVIVIVTPEMAMMRVQALIQEHYGRCVPLREQEVHAKAIREQHRLPGVLWDNYLKAPVEEALKEEYGSFVAAGMITKEKLERAIFKVINSLLPSHVVEAMLEGLNFCKNMDEKTRKAICWRYDLAVPAEETSYNHMAAIRETGARYGVEIGVSFAYGLYKRLSNPQTATWAKNQYMAFLNNLPVSHEQEESQVTTPGLR